VAEWSKAAVLKTVVPQGTVGSNPTLSAMTEKQRVLKWQAFEYEHGEKSPDWFWALWIIAIAGTATSVILGNVLFAILILAGAFTFSLHAVKKPRLIKFEINERGVMIGKILYPFSALKSFWIEDMEESVPPKILIKSKKMLATHIVIPVEDIHPSDIREFLLERLPEEEDSESLAQKIVEHFGF
jgi:hypothetical protein